jgi:hypothetical protein
MISVEQYLYDKEVRCCEIDITVAEDLVIMYEMADGEAEDTDVRTVELRYALLRVLEEYVGPEYVEMVKQKHGQPEDLFMAMTPWEVTDNG